MQNLTLKDILNGNPKLKVEQVISDKEVIVSFPFIKKKFMKDRQLNH